MKACNTCGIDKALSEYHKRQGMIDGHVSKCIECSHIRAKELRQANRQQDTERMQRWRKANPDNDKAASSRYYANNKSVIHARAKAKHANNPDIRRFASREYYKENKDKCLLSAKEWRDNNKERMSRYREDNKDMLAKGRKDYRIRNPHVNAERRAHKINATPIWADKNAIKDVYLEAKYFDMQVDHIIPLNSKLVCGLHVWDNLQLLTALDNRLKSNKFEIMSHV